MLTLPSNTTEPLFKWQVTVGGEVFELSDREFTRLLEMEQKGVRLVKIKDKVINPAFIQSSKKVYQQQNPINEYIDWSAIENNKPVIKPEEAKKNVAIIKEDIQKLMLEGRKNLDKIRDEQHALAVADVWEHLKYVLSTLQFPIKDDNWQDDKSITSHLEGRESHPVGYYTKKINLGDDYDEMFWAEASYAFCPICQKEIKKDIKIFNDYQGEVYIKKLV